MSWSVSVAAMPRIVGCLRSPLLVGVERGDDVLGALARDHRHLVDLGEAGLVAHDAVAADAHRDLLRCAGARLPRRLRRRALAGAWRLAASRHASDSQGKERGQQLVHFARTIPWDADLSSAAIISGATSRASGRPASLNASQRPAHEVPRLPDLRRHARPDAGGQRRDHAQAPAAGQGRTRHRQDDAGRGSGAGARHAAAAVAHQVDHQGAAGPVRIRRGEPPARLAARRRAGARTSTTTSSRACCGRPSRPTSRWRC